MSKLTILILLVLLCLQKQQLRSRAQDIICAGEIAGGAFSRGRSYSSCILLPYLNATLFWTYYPSSAALDVAYRAPQVPAGWVAWAINPTGRGMVGANAFLAFPNAATGATTVITTQLRRYSLQPSDIRDEALTFAVYGREAEYSARGGYYTIYATVELPGNRTTQNTVWQASTTFAGGVPYNHPFDHDHLSSFASLDFLTEVEFRGDERSRQRREKCDGRRLPSPLTSSFLSSLFISTSSISCHRKIKPINAISGHEAHSPPLPLLPLLAGAELHRPEVRRCKLLQQRDLRLLQRPLLPRGRPPLDLPRFQRHHRRRVPSAAVRQRLGCLGHQPHRARHGRCQRLPRLPLNGWQPHPLHHPVRQHQIPRLKRRRPEPHLRCAQPPGRVLRRRWVLHHLRLAGPPRQPDYAEHGVAGVHFLLQRRAVWPSFNRRQRRDVVVGGFSLRPIIFIRRRTEASPEEHSRRGERDQLGNSAARRSHHSEVREGLQVGRPRLVLPPRSLPVLRLHRRPRRLDPRPPARQRLQGNHLPQAQEPRHRHLHPRHRAGVRPVRETQQGPQAQTLLEHLPLRRRVRRHRHEHRQHLRGLRHPGPRQEVEAHLHRHHRHARRRRAGAGSHHLAHSDTEEELRQGWPCSPRREWIHLKPRRMRQPVAWPQIDRCVVLHTSDCYLYYFVAGSFFWQIEGGSIASFLSTFLLLFCIYFTAFVESLSDVSISFVHV